MKRLTSQNTLPLMAAFAVSGGLYPVMAQTTAPNAGTTNQATGTGTTAATAPAVDTQGDNLQGVLFPFSLLDYALYNNIDKNGNVDYLGLKNNQYLNRFAKAVANADVTAFPTFKSTVQKEDKRGRVTTETIEDRSWLGVFWINAYNGLMLKAIADAYPVNSPDEIKDLDTAKTRMVGGKAYSFKEMRALIAAIDPRALFTLTDGTQSGPLLWNQAFRFSCGEGCYLNDQLDKAVRVFINDDQRNVELNRIQNEVTVNEFLAQVDEAFKPKAARRKWDGIRYLLANYTGDARSGKNYYTTNEYNVKFKRNSRNLNNKIQTQ